MGYSFTKGRYRAFVRTTYRDHNGDNQTVDGSAQEFSSDAVSYLSFVTDPNIKVDEDTLTAPNAELIDEGTHKGLNYKIYDNHLAIVSGTQTEAIDTSNPPEWCAQGVFYIYAKATFCSGNVFRTDYGMELQFGPCGFAPGTANATTLFFGRHWLVINFRRINWNNLSSYASIINTYTVEAYGFDEFKNHVLNDPNVTDLANVFTALRLSRQEVTFNIDIPTRISSATYMLSSFGGPGVTVNLHMTDWISNALMGAGPIGQLNLTVDNPIPNYTTILGYSDVIKFHANVEIISTAELCCIIENNADLEEVIYGDDESPNRFNTSTISSFNNALRNNPKLVRAARRYYGRDGWVYTFPFDFDAARTFTSMCENDRALMYLGSNATSDLTLDTNVRYMYYDKMFKGCASYNHSISIIERTGYISSMESAFEDSGITDLFFEQYGTSGRLNQIMANNFRYMCRNAINLNFVDITFNSTFGIASVRYDSMFEGCTNLVEVTINGVYLYDSATGYQYSSIDIANSMFKNCTSLMELSISECDIGNDSNGDTTDMLSGCMALVGIALSQNTVVPSSKAITLPKTMYLNGSAVNSITKSRGSQAVYTSTP